MTDSPRTTQFSLFGLLTIVTLAAVYCALLKYAPGLFLVAGILGVYALAVWAKVSGEKIAWFGMMALCLIALVAMLLILQMK